MPTHEPPDHPLQAVLHQAFETLEDAGDVDVMVNLAALEFDIQADEWTLHLEGWPLTLAFVALDDEPVTLADRETALDAALESQHMAALREVNQALDNALAAALSDSGDGLSTLLAIALEASLEPSLSEPEDDEDG